MMNLASNLIFGLGSIFYKKIFQLTIPTCDHAPMQTLYRHWYDPLPDWHEAFSLL